MLKVGFFINSEKLADTELFFLEDTGAFYMKGPAHDQQLTIQQVLELDKQNFISWERPEILRQLLASSNKIADNPLQGIEIEDVNQGIKPVTQARFPFVKVLGISLGLILLLGVCLVVSINFKSTKWSFFGGGVSEIPLEDTSTPTPSEAELLREDLSNFIVEFQEEVSGKKAEESYYKKVNHEDLSEDFINGYLYAYKKVYPDTNDNVSKAVRELYKESYDKMVTENLAEGKLSGLPIAGEIKSIDIISRNEFLVHLQEKNKPVLDVEVLRDKDGYKVTGIANSNEYNSLLVQGD